MTAPSPLSDADLLAWTVVLEYRRRQQDEGLKFLLLSFPPCPTCQETVTEAKTWTTLEPTRHDGVISVQPCGHTHTATASDMERIHDHASEMLGTLRRDDQSPGGKGWSIEDIVREAHARLGELVQEATEATELDKTRRYLRPVRATIISAAPAGVHLAVYEWLPMFEEWATGPGICGESMRQGPLPEGTEVTCADCLKWQPKYERMLAPGYRPEDDDPDALRQRAAVAERQVLQAKALVAKWRQIAAGEDGATVRVDVAAGILLATLDGFNDLLAEVEER